MTDLYREYWAGRTNAQPRYSDEEFFRKIAEEMLCLFPVGGTILDVGCGDGKILRYLAPRFDEVTGIDVSESMLTVARTHARESGVSYIQFEQGDACRFPSSVRNVDLIVSNGMIQYLDPAEVGAHLRECRRVLKPGGTIGIFSIPCANFRRLFRLGGTRGTPLSLARVLWRYLRNTSKAIWAQLGNGVPIDTMGFWYTYDAIADLASSEGFECETVGAWHYEYRFHAILRCSKSEGIDPHSDHAAERQRDE